MTDIGQTGSFDELVANAENALTAKEYKRCHQYCMTAIKLNPHRPDPFFLLGLLAADHNNFGKALELTKRSLAIDPNNPRFLCQNAKLLTLLGHQQEASQVVDRAIKENPEDPLSLDTIGVVLARIGRHQEALSYFEKSVQLRPDNASFQYNLGSAFQFIGRFEDAQRALEKSIALNPNDFRVYTSLTSLKKQTEQDNHIDVMARLFSETEDADARLQLGHALAKSHEDLGMYREAMDWLVQGKSLKRETLNYSFNQHNAIFEAAENLRTNNIHSEPETLPLNPVFIVGMPRTGTTLVDRIISSHPSATSMGELTDFGSHLKAATGTPSRFVLDAETLSQATSIDLEQIGEQYLNSTERLRGEHAIFVDKMPLNFFYVPALLSALPSARVIVLRRNPMDTCLSNFRQLFRTSYSYYNYSYDLKDTAKFYARFDRLMTKWRGELPSSRFREFNYESIVEDQERESREIISFCGLTWNEDCLDFHKNKAPVATASSVQVRNPIYSTSVERWKKYGTSTSRLYDALMELGVNVD